MNKKLFILLISWMLGASGLYAQSIFVDQNEDVETVIATVPTPVDTVVTHENEIQVLERTWGLNLEDFLRDKIIYLSNHASKWVWKRDIQFVYKVFKVPCRSGERVVFLSMTENREFFLSLQDPTTITQDGFYSCYLDYGEATTVSSSRHYTDDEVFGRPASNAQSRWLEAIEF